MVPALLISNENELRATQVLREDSWRTLNLLHRVQLIHTPLFSRQCWQDSLTNNTLSAKSREPTVYARGPFRGLTFNNVSLICIHLHLHINIEPFRTVHTRRPFYCYNLQNWRWATMRAAVDRHLSTLAPPRGSNIQGEWLKTNFESYSVDCTLLYNATLTTIASAPPTPLSHPHHQKTGKAIIHEFSVI